MSSFKVNETVSIKIGKERYEGKVKGFIVEKYGIIEKEDNVGSYGVSIGTGNKYAIVSDKNVYDTITGKGADYSSKMNGYSKGGSRKKTGTRRNRRY